MVTEDGVRHGGVEQRSVRPGLKFESWYFIDMRSRAFRTVSEAGKVGCIVSVFAVDEASECVAP